MSDNRNADGTEHVITDSNSNVSYRRGKFLGKGAYSECYEFKNTSTGELFAGKVVPKSYLKNPYYREKMVQEIDIHSSMSYKYIVSLRSYFEDESNMYIILELCRHRSLMEMLQRRKTLTSVEVRYFMLQIVLACRYMHDNRVIHRDLKLDNLFINDSMEVKVGDFGLATRLASDGERKMSICGTPDYTAPEILGQKGHSYKADIWSLGCIMHALFVGSPPFENRSIETTIAKIKNNEYFLPPNLDTSAKQLIRKLLDAKPERRPRASSILGDAFFCLGYIPFRIPNSCLIMEPRSIRNTPLQEKSNRSVKKSLNDKGSPDNVIGPKESTAANVRIEGEKLEEVGPNMQNNVPDDFYLRDLFRMVESLVKSKAATFNGNDENVRDLTAFPFYWISKWLNYSDRYGVGYQLCDDSLGVIFIDNTHLILLADCKTLQHVDRNNEYHYYSVEDYPNELKKNFTLLKYFKAYMFENLSATGENSKPRERNEMTRVPHLLSWLQTKSAMIFHLSNGTLQLNFFKDHSKIILCPHMQAVSYIDESKNFTVYAFKLIEKYGCSEILAAKLRYAKSILKRLCSDFKQSGNEETLLCQRYVRKHYID